MKDITDYLKSSPDNQNTKKSGTANIEIAMKTSKKESKISESTPKSRNITNNKNKSLSGSEVSPSTPKSKNKRTPKNKNKTTPVRSPLEAYNRLFNVNKKQSAEKDTANSKMETINSVEIEESISLDSEISLEMKEISDTPKLSEKKVDAFQFLMMNRNKVIGTNSPGKELPEQDIAPKCSPKLLSRKRLLQSWSDSIQAKKPKLNDDEIDTYIKVKLSTRKERLKSLLHIDDNSVDKAENTSKSKRKHSIKNTKTKKTSNSESMSSSTESSKEISKKMKNRANEGLVKPDQIGISSVSSEDDFEMKTSNSTEVSIPKASKSHKHKNKSKDTPKLPLTPRSKWKMKIKLINHDFDDTSCDKEDEDVILLSDCENTAEEVTEKMDCQSMCMGKIEEEGNEIIVNHGKNSVEAIGFQNEITHHESKNTSQIDEENNIALDESSVEVTEKMDIQTETIEHHSTETPKSNDEILENGEKITECRRVLRNRTCLNKNEKRDYVYSSPEDTDDEIKRKNKKKALRIAPVFTKALPKPKIDPEVLKARRNFLMSEMPDELRRRVEKLPSNGHNIEVDFDVFPKVSHTYQEEKNNPLWNLPNSHLNLKNTTPLEYKPSELICQSLIDSSIIQQSRYYKESEPIKYPKRIMQELKSEHTNYPVFRAFRLLKEKNGFKTELAKTKTIPKRGRKSKKSSEQKENCSASTDEQTLKHLMWTEKYKPKSSEDFFGNIQAVSSLKRWLVKWREILDSGKRKKRYYSNESDTEYLSSDAESIYDRSLLTTMVLSGPCGSGKSSSVYAVCNELGLNVLELNASSRRTGKQVLQELQEATRSHQVRKHKGSLDSFTQKGISSKDEDKNKSRKMCVLLIEDIDIVFEQDEGFISAISQISATSKRPIILTTTNKNSVYAQKFMNEFKTIRFHSLSVKCLGIWLQILCVLEGIFVDLASIGELLEYNKGDIRKTLLELQYWIQSGGQINKGKNFIDPIFKIESPNEEDNLNPIFDDAGPSFEEMYHGESDNYRCHTNILSDFEMFDLVKFNNIPTTINLKTLWWNIPKFLYPIKPNPLKLSSKKSKTRTRKKLKLVSNMYDSIAMFDVSYRKINYKCDEPVGRTRWHHQLQDSLELEEKLNSYSINQDILELNHYLTDGYLNRCREKFIYETSENQRFLNMAVPGLEKERQLNNNHKYENELLRPVPSINSLDRKSVVLDYLPSLRTIARNESIRARSNEKRYNRFHNYLQNLSISCDTPILDFATRTFSVSSYSK